jgi:DNA-binding beta-propeller fold protein YncE
MPHAHRPLSAVFALLALLAFAAPSRAAETRAFVTTTDFNVGRLRALDLDTRAVLAPSTSVHTDTRLRWFNGMLYVINRLGQDNIQVIDPATLGTTFQFSTGNGSNPADIAFVSSQKAYVTLYERADLAIVNPESGASLGSIPLGGFADADGIPEMDHMVRVGPYLFVAIQRLDRNHNFAPTDYSAIVVIDTRTDTVVDADPVEPGVQPIKLTGKNPVTPFAFDPASGKLLIGCVGAYGPLDGGIEWVDPVAMASAGWAITESALGGEISGLAWSKAGHSYAIISDASFNASLVTWSATTGSKLATLYAPGGFSLSDLAIDDRGELYVSNSSFTAPGMMVWSTTTDALLAGPIDTGLPPNQICFDQANGAAASVEPPGPALAFSAPWPNPARTSLALDLWLERGAPARVDVFDLGGRRVRALLDERRSAGSSEVRWDLKDDRGAVVPAGVYLVRARAAGKEVTKRAVVVH